MCVAHDVNASESSRTVALEGGSCNMKKCGRAGVGGRYIWGGTGFVMWVLR